MHPAALCHMHRATAARCLSRYATDCNVNVSPPADLTSTFSSALKLGETDSLEAALLSKGLHQERSLNHTSDSFKRFMAHLGCDEAGGLATGLSGNALEGMLDGNAAGFNPQDFLAGNSRGRGGAMDAAAAAAIAAIDAEAQQQRGKQLQSSK